MANSSWVAKITYNGKTVCANVFDDERTAVAFVQRIALALSGRCEMRTLYHTIHITEEVCETYPQHFPLSTKKRDIVIVEAELKEKKIGKI